MRACSLEKPSSKLFLVHLDNCDFTFVGTDSSSSIRHSIHQSVFTPTTPAVAPRDLPMSWDQQSKLLPGVNQYKANIITEWSVAQVAEFVSSLPGCADFAKIFTDEVSERFWPWLDP